MKKTVFLLLLSSASMSIKASEIHLPYEALEDQVLIVNPTKATLYKDMEVKANKVWELTKGFLKIKEKIQGPVLVLEEFKQGQNQKEWTDFQTDWKNWLGESAEEPFNAKMLPAYFYIKTPNIQMRPSFIHEGISSSPVMPKIKGTRHALYTLGHEINHYLLDKKGVDVKLHHCLMIRRLDGENTSLHERLLNKLVSLSIVKKMASIMLMYERRTLPCRRLSKIELEEVDKLLGELK